MTPDQRKFLAAIWVMGLVTLGIVALIDIVAETTKKENNCDAHCRPFVHAFIEATCYCADADGRYGKAPALESANASTQKNP